MSGDLEPGVIELVELDIVADRGDDFALEVAGAVAAFEGAPGFRWLELARGIERDVFFLRVGWDDIDAHIRFRASDRYGNWSRRVGPYLAGAPSAEHAAIVFDSRHRP